MPDSSHEQDQVSVFECMREMDMKTDSGFQNKCSASGKGAHRRQVPYLGIKEVRT